LGWGSSRNGRGELRRRLIQFRGSFREAVADIFAHPRFIRFTLASMVFHFMWQTAWPLFTLYQVKVLGANNLWISLLTLSNTGGAIIGYGFWASFADRRGHLRSLVVSTLGIFMVPLYYAFSHSLTTITVLNFATGAVFAGVNLSLFNVLLEHTPEEHKTTYIAYYHTAITLTTVFAPVCGVALLGLLGFFWAFIACAVGRIVGSMAFYLVLRSEEREVGAQPPAAEASGDLPA
jgi:predicted MFS family arabinose efflux permease